jgi:hypothetical protein
MDGQVLGARHRAGRVRQVLGETAPPVDFDQELGELDTWEALGDELPEAVRFLGDLVGCEAG